MARGEAGSAATEFFICIGDEPGLDHGARRNPDGLGSAAFGRVIRGMEAVERIHRLPADAFSDNAYTRGQIIEVPAVILEARRIN